MVDWTDDLPDDVEYVIDDGGDISGNTFKLRIAMPSDDQNRIVVRCPSDNDHRFAIRLNGEDDVTEVYCVACGHRDSTDEFLTDDARRRITEISQAAVAHHIVGRMQILGLRYTPNPLPQTFYTYEQEQTRRAMCCGRCGESFAVFGPASFCPGLRAPRPPRPVHRADRHRAPDHRQARRPAC